MKFSFVPSPELARPRSGRFFFLVEIPVLFLLGICDRAAATLSSPLRHQRRTPDARLWRDSAHLNRFFFSSGLIAPPPLRQIPTNNLFLLGADHLLKFLTDAPKDSHGFLPLFLRFSQILLRERNDGAHPDEKNTSLRARQEHVEDDVLQTPRLDLHSNGELRRKL